MKSGLKIGSAVVALGIVAGLIFFVSRLQSQVNSKDGEIRLLTAEKAYMAWEWSIDRDKLDTLRNIGEYGDTDTLWQTRIRIDTLPGKIDTVYESIGDIRGVIKIDTSKSFGPGPDSLKIQVEGRLYYPEEFTNRSWLLIYRELGSGKPPYQPPEPSQAKRWGLGLSYVRSFSDTNPSDYFGLSGRYKRITVASGYDFWRKSLISGISIELLTF